MSNKLIIVYAELFNTINLLKYYINYKCTILLNINKLK